MRVLMTADTLGGVFTYATVLGGWLRARGVGVTLACMGGPLSADQDRAAKDAGVQVMSSEYQLEWMPDPWQDVRRAGAWLLGLERQLRPDIVHLNGYAHSALPWGAPALVVAHSCVASWWRAVFGKDGGDAQQRYRREVERGLRAASAVVAPSRAMLRCLEEEYGFASGQVIYNGIAASELSASIKEPLVLCAGRLWDAGKNAAQLARVAPALRWPVLLAGERLAPGADQSGTFEHVRLLGKLSREELRAWMHRAAIFASPARYEPFGLSILEAAVSGCALVLGDIPSLRELWQDAALFVDPADASALEAALRRLIDDDALRAALSERARERAQRYGIEAMGQAYQRLYEELARKARTARELEASL